MPALSSPLPPTTATRKRSTRIQSAAPYPGAGPHVTQTCRKDTAAPGSEPHSSAPRCSPGGRRLMGCISGQAGADHQLALPKPSRQDPPSSSRHGTAQRDRDGRVLVVDGLDGPISDRQVDAGDVGRGDLHLADRGGPLGEQLECLLGLGGEDRGRSTPGQDRRAWRQAARNWSTLAEPIWAMPR